MTALSAMAITGFVGCSVDEVTTCGFSKRAMVRPIHLSFGGATRIDGGDSYEHYIRLDSIAPSLAGCVLFVEFREEGVPIYSHRLKVEKNEYVKSANGGDTRLVLLADVLENEIVLSPVLNGDRDSVWDEIWYDRL